MKIEDLKLGMRVRATGGYGIYTVTNKKQHWIGIVVDINIKTGKFIAKTESCDKQCVPKNYIFEGLNPKYFEPTKKEANLPMREEKELLRVTEHNGKIKVWYKDAIIAEAKCSEDDTYDEEFGLNLALRRFCKTLNDSHEVVITRRKTENVEDFL